MTKLTRFALLILILFCAATVLAQEVTQEAPAEEAAPVVVVENPEEEADSEVTEQAPVTVIIEAPLPDETQNDVSQSELLIASFLVLSLLFNAVQAFWGKGSIPPNVANEIFAGLRVLANTTKTEDDNKLIDAGEAAYNALMPKAPPEEKPRD